MVNGFPLKIVPKETREVEVDFNAEFLTHMLPKMEWSAFVNAAKEIGLEGLPSEIPDDAASDDSCSLFREPDVRIRIGPITIARGGI